MRNFFKLLMSMLWYSEVLLKKNKIFNRHFQICFVLVKGLILKNIQIMKYSRTSRFWKLTFCIFGAWNRNWILFANFFHLFLLVKHAFDVINNVLSIDITSYFYFKTQQCVTHQCMPVSPSRAYYTKTVIQSVIVPWIFRWR